MDHVSYCIKKKQSTVVENVFTIVALGEKRFFLKDPSRFLQKQGDRRRCFQSSAIGSGERNERCDPTSVLSRFEFKCYSTEVRLSSV